MNAWRIIVRNLFFYRRINLAVALGVAAATAVLTGALLVGDTMRHSLRDVALERLARVDEVLSVPHFFREELASELSQSSAFQEAYANAVPALVFPQATIQSGQGDEAPTATDVFLIASNASFWELDRGQATPKRPPTGREIILNAQLAQDLGVDAEAVANGEEVLVTLRVPKPQNIHGDSALGKKDDIVLPVTGLRVIEVLPNKGIARFGLHPTQTVTTNAFVDLEMLQELVNNSLQPRRRSRRDEPDRVLVRRPVNTILVAGNDPENPPSEEASRALNEALRPTLADLSLALDHVQLTWQPEGEEESQVAHEYFNLSSRQMMLDEQTETIAMEAFEGLRPQSALTYLANEISVVRDGQEVTEEPIPFSTITAIDFTEAFAPTSANGESPAQPLSDTGIALSEWAASDLEAKVGDTIRVKYYDPETTHGQPVEQIRDFTLEQILAFTPRELSGGQRGDPLPFRQPPTWINDPELTPYVPGFSDAESISQPNVLPFPTMDKMRPSGVDDQYWYRYRTTPKAFVTLKTGKELWSSRFGSATMVRVPAQESVDERLLGDRFLEEKENAGAELGFAFMPIKRQWLASSSGTTPFDVLFLSLSFFIIASAIILISLLFRLSVEQRAQQVGTLLAMGFPRSSVSWLLIGEGIVVSAVGGILGILIGIGYGALMVYLLTTVWVGAIVTPFLKFSLSIPSLLIGFVAGLFVSAATITLTIWLSRNVPVRDLLSGRLAHTTVKRVRKSLVVEMLVAVGLVAAVGLAAWATQLGGEMQGGVFVGAGFLLLGSLLLATWHRLRVVAAAQAAKLPKRFSLQTMSLSNVGRNAGRSTLTIGLVAVASFLIVAISAFRLEPTSQGTAGFDYIVQTSLPVYEDLDSVAGRERLFGERAQDLDGARIMAFRFKPGDNASCNNPYVSSQPRILGMTREAAQRFDRDDQPAFAWAGSTAESESQADNPWHLLFSPHEANDETIPVVIDKNTAMYSLRVYSVGSEFEMTYDEGQTIRFRVVGFLANSVLQGSLICSEEDLERLFPDTSGYRYFLVSIPGEANSDVQQENATRILDTMRRQLGDQGFSAVATRAVLRDLLAVQNTYLSTFQSLGALGLLFGTLGLGTVQLRNVLERRRELALMRAEGFARKRLASLLLLENASVLLRGLGIGVGAALFAVLPYMIFGDASIPWWPLILMLVAIALVGFATSGLAIRLVYRAPLLTSLREE